jgi:hypothetical protein
MKQKHRWIDCDVRFELKLKQLTQIDMKRDKNEVKREFREWNERAKANLELVFAQKFPRKGLNSTLKSKIDKKVKITVNSFVPYERLSSWF